MESNDHRAQSLRWTVECREGKVKDPSSPKRQTFGQSSTGGMSWWEKLSRDVTGSILDSVMKLICGKRDLLRRHASLSFWRISFQLDPKGKVSKQGVRISVENDRWMISVPEREGDSTILVEYDPQKGAVLGATWQNINQEKRCGAEFVTSCRKSTATLGAKDDQQSEFV